MVNFAFVFPGQGSQSLGMLAELARIFSIVKTTFGEASKVIGYDLWHLVQNGPLEELNKTYKTQPALLTSSIAIYRVWKQQCYREPSILAGHSLGEYSALVCANVINFSDALKLVALRGYLMQQEVPEGIGKMQVIIGLDKESVSRICRENSKEKVVSPVSFNSSKQIVIGGHREEVERVSMACLKAGAKRILTLPISVPSHCILMKPIANKLAKILEQVHFKLPTIPVVNNVDAIVETSGHAIRSALIRQLYNPIRWVETIEFITSQGIYTLFEIGPGKVLTNLNKSLTNKVTAISVNDLLSLETAVNKI
ncbi:ACP S-malonyltransferase [Candidatus Ishikawella capsulata]|nr:ACP S-malonyltransferase [Candidatus Ishikawaella capsulata]